MEGLIERPSEGSGSAELASKCDGLTGGGVTGDLTLDESCIDAANAAWFASAIDIGHRGLLHCVHFDNAIFKGAAEQYGQFSVGHEAVGVGDVIARFFPDIRALAETDALDAIGTKGGFDPAIGEVAARPKVDGLHEFCGMGDEAGGEVDKRRKIRLLGDEGDGGAFGL
jgi:hypothetical protein